MSAAVVVAGSLNMDFVVRVDHLPSPGETVLGGDFRMIPGGKGANQACAAGKLGESRVRIRMIGRVGYDVFADHLKASLAAAGVDVSAVHAARSQPTGVALIWVDRAGQNSIVVAPGANHALAEQEVEGMRAVLRGARFALFQLETPLKTVAAALKLAREEGVRTMLDPAPAQPLSSGRVSDRGEDTDAFRALGCVDILTPNETEACILLGRHPERITPAEAPQFARALLAMGPVSVVLKLGEYGCFFSDGTRELHVPGFTVEAVDTTAAGDTFNAALAVALAEDQPLTQSLRFANAAAAISVTRVGAQASVPTRAEVERLLSAAGE